MKTIVLEHQDGSQTEVEVLDSVWLNATLIRFNGNYYVFNSSKSGYSIPVFSYAHCHVIN